MPGGAAMALAASSRLPALAMARLIDEVVKRLRICMLARCAVGWIDDAFQKAKLRLRPALAGRRPFEPG
jgi:hypothetical protein